MSYQRTAQDIFNEVKTHLLTQNARAEICLGTRPSGAPDMHCRYRTPEGLKCAVGCLIPGAEYTPELEGKSVEQLIDGAPSWSTRPFGSTPLSDALRAEFRPHLRLLCDLQNAHDGFDPPQWAGELSRVAAEHHLHDDPVSPA